LPGETPTLYELGIPVVETGDRWHVSVGQEVPLTPDRTNVPPAYLRAVRVGVLNALTTRIVGEEATQPRRRVIVVARGDALGFTLVPKLKGVLERHWGAGKVRELAYVSSPAELPNVVTTAHAPTGVVPRKQFLV